MGQAAQAQADEGKCSSLVASHLRVVSRAERTGRCGEWGWIPFGGGWLGGSGFYLLEVCECS